MCCFFLLLRNQVHTRGKAGIISFTLVCVFPVEEAALIITRDVYLYCSAEIKEWTDMGAMQGQLMKYGVIQTPDDMHSITDGPPSRRRDYVLCKVCQIRNGSALLYQCLRESQDCQMGHRDAADALLERVKCASGEVMTVNVGSFLPPFFSFITLSSSSLPPSHTSHFSHIAAYNAMSPVMNSMARV